MESVTFRGRTRSLQIIFGVVLAVGAVLIAALAPPEMPFWGRVLAVLAAPVFLLLAFRWQSRGITADARGLTVRNTVTTRHVPWTQLRSIHFGEVRAVGGWVAYHRLEINAVDRGQLVSEAPGGNKKPGQYLSNVRDTLRAMRDEVIALAEIPQ